LIAGGQERTAEEIKRLLAGAGLEPGQTTEAGDDFAIV